MNVLPWICLFALLETGSAAASQDEPPPPGIPEFRIPKEADPALAPYYAPLPVPPGTPVIDAADAAALEKHLFKPVIVRCTVTGRVPPLKDQPDAGLRVPILKDSRLALHSLVNAAIYRALGVEGAAPETLGPLPRTIYVAGVVELAAVWYGKGHDVSPMMKVYSPAQIAETSDGVRFSWVARPYFAGEWKVPDPWYPLPPGMALDTGGPPPAARIHVTVMRPDAVAAVVAPVSACFAAGPDDGRIVIDSQWPGVMSDRTNPWRARVYHEVTRHAAAGKKWPRGMEWHVSPGAQSGSPFAGPDPVNAAGAAVVLDALLNRHTLRNDVALAAELGGGETLVPVRLLTERLSAAQQCGITTVIVAKGSEEQAALAAQLVGANFFTSVQVIAAATVSEATLLASESSRAKLDAAAARMQSLRTAPSPEKLFQILQRVAAVKELNALATGPPVNVSAAILLRAGRKEVPVSLKPAQVLPLPFAVMRLEELSSWKWEQFEALVPDKKSWTNRLPVGNPPFARSLIATTNALLPRLPPKLEAAGKTALSLGKEMEAQEAEIAAGRAFGEYSTVELRDTLKKELADAKATKPK